MILRKLIALLLFIFGLALVFFMFLFFFISFEGSIKINSNIEDYEVKINSIKTAFNKTQTCEVLECQIDSIPVGEVRLLISKEGYNDIIKESIIDKDNIASLDIELKKLSSLELEENLENNENKTSNKIKLIKSKYNKELEDLDLNIENSETIIGLKKLENNFLEIKEFNIKNTKLIAEINLENINYDNDKGDIIFEKIENTNNNYYLKIENNVYIIGDNIQTKNFKFKPKINYIKYESLDSSYIIISSSGAFVLNKNTNKLVYNTKFDDFVILDKNYIGYIKSSSREKLSDFDLKTGKDYIVQYNPNTLEKNIILEPNINIIKIIKENNYIYAIDEEDNKYKLEINN